MTRSVRIILLLIVKLGLLAAMLISYAIAMAGGTEIVIRAEPVDPRSLLRGHYVRLGYGIETLDTDLLGTECYDYQDAVFVTLAPASDYDWRPVAVSGAMPEDGFENGRVTLRAIVDHGFACVADEAPDRTFRVDYGLSAFFASPKMARALETRLRTEEGLPVILSVPKSGRALIKGVIVDGERVVDDSIF